MFEFIGIALICIIILAISTRFAMFAIRKDPVKVNALRKFLDFLLAMAITLICVALALYLFK